MRKKYVALLRGINVGGNNRVEMKKLKQVFESLGFDAVSTYINSGNVLFESDQSDTDALVAKIEKALNDSFGFPLKIVLRDKRTLESVCKAIPPDWENNAEQKSDVLFLWDAFQKKSTIDLIDTNPNADTLKYASGSILWNVKKKVFTKSRMKKFIGTIVYKNMTARNVNTVRKLLVLMNTKTS